MFPKITHVRITFSKWSKWPQLYGLEKDFFMNFYDFENFDFSAISGWVEGQILVIFPVFGEILKTWTGRKLPKNQNIKNPWSVRS